MPKLYLIHPAVGCARMGNSKNGVQIAPEDVYHPSIGSFLDVNIPTRQDLSPVPREDKFRGQDNKIRRQGVRFRIFEYQYEDQAGLAVLKGVKEVTTQEFEIEWTITLANKKIKDWKKSIASSNNRTVTIGGELYDVIENDNRATVTVTHQELTNEGTVIRELRAPNRLKLGDVLVEPAGQIILIGSEGETKLGDNLLLSGLYNKGWEDDAADGPVTAKIRPKNTSADWIDIEQQNTGKNNGAAWAIVGPPRFGGDVKPLVSLYDLTLSFATDGNPYPTGMDFTNTRFTRDIYPILESMLLSAQVFASAYDNDGHIHYRTNYFHDAGTSPYTTIKSSGFDIPGSVDPIRALYFSRLTPPDSPDLKQDRFGMYPDQVISLSSDQSALETTNPRLLDIGNDPDEPAYRPKYMPKLFSLALTHLQYNHMKNWVDGNFVNDFVADPRIPQAHSPDPWKIDLAHMRSISGGSFFPGIEVGSNAWNKELWQKFSLTEKLRLLHFNRDPLVRLDTKKISEGTLTSTLGCPWQADYMACEDYWWPASRPISLLTDPNDPSGLIYRWHPPAPTPEATQFVWEGLGYMQLLGTPPYSGRVVERERTARVPTPQQPVIHP